MRVWYCDHHEVPLPEGHRFPMTKYRRLRDALTTAGVVRPDELEAADPGDPAPLRRAHADHWVDAVFQGTLSPAEERRLGTIELLLTLPITQGQAVVGKFLAAWAFCAIALALTFPLVLTVN